MKLISRLFLRVRDRRFRIWAGLLLSTGITTIAVVLYLLGAGQTLEARTLDMRFRIRGARQMHDALRMVVIGDESIRVVGRWPWKRSIHALMIDILSSARAHSVIYDVLFTEPADDDPRSDTVLAFAAGKARNVYFPFYFYIDSSDGKDSSGSEHEDEFCASTALDEHKISGTGFYRASEATIPIEILRGSIRGTGFVNAMPDTDGITRKVPLVIRYGDSYIPHIALSAACEYLGVSLNDLRITPWGNLEIPLSAEHSPDTHRISNSSSPFTIDFLANTIRNSLTGSALRKKKNAIADWLRKYAIK